MSELPAKPDRPDASGPDPLVIQTEAHILTSIAGRRRPPFGPREYSGIDFTTIDRPYPETPVPIPVWAPKMVDEVDLLAGPDGTATLKIRKGDRIAWDDPAGLGGVTLYGTVAGIQVQGGSLFPGEILTLAVEADPSEELRALLARWRKDVAPLKPLPDLHLFGSPRGYHQTPQKCGLDGDGGPVLFSGDGVRWAGRANKIRVLSTKTETP